MTEEEKIKMYTDIIDKFDDVCRPIFIDLSNKGKVNLNLASELIINIGLNFIFTWLINSMIDQDVLHRNMFIDEFFRNAQESLATGRAHCIKCVDACSVSDKPSTRQYH